MPFGEWREAGVETLQVKCPRCGRPCVIPRGSGPVLEFHPADRRGQWTGARTCRWIALPDSVGEDHRYVIVPEGDRHGDWLERLRAAWEERYRVRAYLSERAQG